MSSASDADDERESPAPTPITPWIDPKSLLFTVFVVLPNDDVCTMRDIPSGLAVFDLKAKLEITAGIPSQIYSLVYPDGEEIPDDQRLLVQETIIDGYLIKMQLNEGWESLYASVIRNNIEHVYHSGGVHLKGNIVISPCESERYVSVVRERGTVALFVASHCGHLRMVSMLLSVGINANGKTQFGRTALHAAVARDRLVILEHLINNGSALQKTDYFGVTPLELSRDLSSNQCMKKLRLMQLNLRGNVDQRSSKFVDERTSKFRNGSRNIDSRVSSHSKVDEVDTQNKYKGRTILTRTVSNLSQHSEKSMPSKSSQDHTLHKSRTHIISSAPEYKSKNKLVFRKCISSPNQSNLLIGSKPNRIVRWRDVPKENMYWQVIELPRKEDASIEKVIHVKPVAIIQQKKVLKFATGSSPEPSCPAGPSVTPNQEFLETDPDKPEINEKAVRFTKAKLRYYRKLRRELDNTRTMRRRIRIAANNDKTPVKEMSDAFKQWLERKARESEQSEEDLESVVSVAGSDDTDTETLQEFNKRVRKMNRIEKRTWTPGNRPISDIVKVGSTKFGNGTNPSASLDISAHSEWKKQQKRYATSQAFDRKKSVNDFALEKRRLEEKRQKLLMNAISYDEWMDHVEDRKFLIKQILKADYEEMKKLEEERFKDRLNRHSFEKWMERLEQREAEDRRRKEIQRRYDAELALDKIRTGRGGYAVPFEEWLSKKRDSETKRTNRARDLDNLKHAEVESASNYEQWITHKQREQPDKMEDQLQKEHSSFTGSRQLQSVILT